MKYIYIVFFVAGAGSATGYGHVDIELDHELKDSTEIVKLLESFRMEQLHKGKSFNTLTATGFQLLRIDKGQETCFEITEDNKMLWRSIVNKAIGSSEDLNDIAIILAEQDTAKQVLRSAGYGCTGRGLLDTAIEVYRDGA